MYPYSFYTRDNNMIRMLSIDLRDETYFNMLYDEGFRYIRQYSEKDFKKIIRNPTMGCIVEIFKSKEFACAAIKSPKGQHLINKSCYF